MNGVERSVVAGIAATSAALLMTELALTRIFSVTMFYHFAFLAISIALFGLSASGVFVYVTRRRLSGARTRELLCAGALLHAATTLVALASLVNMRVGLAYSAENLARMLAIYVLAALPFFTGGAVISLAFARLTARINALYGADLLGAAAGCLALVPLLNLLGAPGVVLAAAALAAAAAVCFAPPHWMRRTIDAAILLVAIPAGLQLTTIAPFDVVDTKGHENDVVLFSKWNSFSRVGVYDRAHDDWSLSPRFTGKPPPSLIMDIDSSASTPILRSDKVEDAAYLRYELTAIAYHLAERPGGFRALVIGPGGGRDLLSALAFGARQVDAVEINPIIVRDVMLGRFSEYSGRLYADPRVSVHVEDGRSFVRRSPQRYDIIQASLVDTWAATAAGAYTLAENSLYTAEAFGDYLDHLSDDGVVTLARWVFDGLRLVSLAQAACERRGLDAAQHIAIVQHRNVMNFILKRTPFAPQDSARLQRVADELGFTLVYAPWAKAPAQLEDTPEMKHIGAKLNDYRSLILASDRAAFLAAYPLDISATTDDRPFFFHMVRLHNQFGSAFGPAMMFDNGLGALLTLFMISTALVLLFIIGPLLLSGGRPGGSWAGWLAYFGLLGAGFMLLEVALLQRFVLLLGHPVYSLTVTLFCLLLGTGLGSLASRRVSLERVRRVTAFTLLAAAALGAAAAAGVGQLVDLAMHWPLPGRIALAAAVLVPLGVLLGTALPGGMRLLDRSCPEMVPWGWGMNGALSVIGATSAIFIAMNWGFSTALSVGAATYLLACAALLTRPAA